MNSFAIARNGSPLALRPKIYAAPPDSNSLGFGSTPDLADPVTAAVANAFQSLRGHVLLVDDSDDDAMLFSRAVRMSGTLAEVHRASNSTEALSQLAEITPALIILDCDLQFENGLDLLRVIRSMRSLRNVPIVIFSGSDSVSDIQSAYELGANSFLRKPLYYDEYLDCVQSMLSYWLDQDCGAMTARSFVSCL
jgi:two-component system, response regulator